MHIGQRIRLRRTLMGLSQEKLGEALGLTFQQVQKYERGANRVSASRLQEIAKAMGVPVMFFYDDMAEEGRRPSGAPVASMTGFAEAPSTFGGPPPRRQDASAEDAALFTRKETIDLVRAYYRIPDPAIRRRMFELIRSMGPDAGPGAGSGEA